MSRPKRCRRVCLDPACCYFKPQGVPMDRLESVSLGLDELEALNLADLKGLTQTDAAKRMDISQATFNRVLSGARGKVAKSLVEGLALRIEATEPAAASRGVGCARKCTRRTEGRAR